MDSARYNEALNQTAELSHYFLVKVPGPSLLGKIFRDFLSHWEIRIILNMNIYKWVLYSVQI